MFAHYIMMSWHFFIPVVCVVWCDVVWCGVMWCGVMWCGVVWCGVVVLAFVEMANVAVFTSYTLAS